MVDKLISFVENGGRFRKNDEPRYGEPFYGDYMKQYISAHYNPGDRVRITTNDQVYEGMILVINYYLELLISGWKVHKDKRNKKDILYSDIQIIELIKENDGSFDLAIIYPEELERQNRKDNTLSSLHSITQHSKNRRIRDCEAFNQVYQNVDFNKSHVIRINDGFGLYFPFEYNGISAEVFLVREDNKITRIPCEVGTPFPNKNSFHAYNYISRNENPCLYLYLPDNGFIYEDINIVCVWTINVTISSKNMAVKVVNIHHIDAIKSVKDEHNLIFLDMNVCPLTGYGESLFTDHKDSSLLTRMMDRDLYFILNLKEDNVVIVKKPDTLTAKDLAKYTYMSAVAINEFEFQDVVPFLTDECKYSPIVEVFCNMDKEPERYYSSSWRNCQKGYEFTMLSQPSNCK